MKKILMIYRKNKLKNKFNQQAIKASKIKFKRKKILKLEM